MRRLELMCEQVFKDFVRQLLQGKVLSVEDMADVLTLKDNKETPEDYAVALQLVSHASVMSIYKSWV